MITAPDSGDLIDEVRSLGIRFRRNEYPRLSNSPWRIPLQLNVFRKLVKEFDPDIIHCDAPINSHYFGLVKGRAKLVTHLRISTPDGFSDRVLAAETDALIAVSNGVAERFRRFPEEICRKLHVIPNAVEIDRFKPVSSDVRGATREEFGLPQGKLLVTMMGAFVPEKRHHFFLDVWADVVREVPGALLLLAGSGEQTEIDKVREHIKRAGLEENVCFMSFVNEPEKLLAAADLAVTPSGLEGLPRVSIEAAACGLPLVVSDAAGVGETVRNGITGYCEPLDDHKRWKHAVVDLLKDNQKREWMGKAAREWIVHEFSAEKHGERVAELYESLLK